MFARRRQGRRGGGNRGYLMFMLLQLFSQVQRLERKPPATLAMMGAMIALYLQPELAPPIQEVCLSPALVLRDTDIFRLIGSAFVHAGDMHLYYNMSSLLWKGVQIELAAGSAAFTAMVATLLVLSHVLIVALGFVLGPLCTGAYTDAFSTCSVGFSAVLFALKVVLNDGSPTHTYIIGMSVPTKYAAWAELVIASMINPRASFLGHLCGIAAGYAWTRGGVGHFIGSRFGNGSNGVAERWANPVRVNSAGGFFGGIGDMFGALFSGEDTHRPPRRTYGQGTTGHANNIPVEEHNGEDEELQRALDESRRQFEREQAEIRSRHNRAGGTSAEDIRRRRLARFG